MSETAENIKQEDILGIECKHAIYVKGNPRDIGMVPDDLIFVKEVVHLKNGLRIPRTRRIKNFERPFYVTKKGFRDHEEKKEWEDIEKLDRYITTQAGLELAIKKALDIRENVHGLRQLGRSPYLYGSDISPTAIVKRYYMDKWPEARSPNRLAVLDVETDVVNGTEDPIYVSITFKNKAILAATKAFVGDIENFEEKMKEYFYKRIESDSDVSKLVIPRNIELEVVVCDTPLDAIKAVFKRCHEWMPDFLSIWNMNYDIPKIIATIEKYGGDVGDIFSDPSVPRQFRKIIYKEGPAKKITASGKEEALHWTDRWHTLYAPASFYVIDQACVFRKLRVANGREPSYALDEILKEHAGTRKLKNDKADTLGKLEWHIYMQKFEKLEYGVYNLYDCISCEILDEQPKVGDLRHAISINCAHSDYDKFPSQPRKTVDDLHFVCLGMNKVIGSTPDDIETEFDRMTTSIKNWIITLPAHLIEVKGISVIDECPHLDTLIYVAVYDQ